MWNYDGKKLKEDWIKDIHLHSKEEKELTKEMEKNVEGYQWFHRKVTQKPRDKAFKTNASPNVYSIKTSSFFFFSSFPGFHIYGKGV